MTDRVELFNRWAESYDRSLLGASGFPFEGYHQVLRRVHTRRIPARPPTSAWRLCQIALLIRAK